MSNDDKNLLIGLNESSKQQDFVEKESIDFDSTKLILVLTKSWYWCLLLLISTCSVAYLYDRYTPRLYNSSSIIQLKFDSKIADVGLQIGQSGDGGASFDNLSEEIELIRSQLIFDKLIRDLNLQESYIQIGNVLNDDRYRNNPFEFIPLSDTEFPLDRPLLIKLISTTEIHITDFNDSFHITTKINVPFEVWGTTAKIKFTDVFDENELGREFIYTRKSNAVLYREINSSLTVGILNARAKTISISYNDNEPNRAFAIVESIDSLYLLQSLDSKRKAQEQTISFINNQLDSAAQKLEFQEHLLESFIQRTKTIDPTGQFEKVISEIELLNEEKITLRMKLEAVKLLVDKIENNDSLELRIPLHDEMAGESIQSAVLEINKLLSELRTTQSSVKKNTSAYQRAAMKVKQAQFALKEDLIHLSKSLLSQQKEVQKQLGLMETDFFNLPSKNTSLKRIQRNYDLYEKYYLMLIEKRVEFGISKAGTVPEFILLNPPARSILPISPNTSLIYSFGLILGIILSFMLVFVRYILSNTILTQKELENGVLAGVLGSLPKYKKEKLKISRLVVDNNPKSAISEALRSIRTNLEFVNSSKKQKISVTSTISGEGKTFVAINLGGILAASGKKVVLIDMDMRKPKVHLGFDLGNEVGMSTLLIGKSKLNDCIHKTSTLNLDVITSGPTPPNPSELILRDSFDESIAALEKEYDVILIDSPPVGLVTDGILIMKKMDIPIYVVRSGYSKRGVIKNINKLFRVSQFKKLSVVLNAVGSEGRNEYGYGYGYGYYEED